MSETVSERAERLMRAAEAEGKCAWCYGRGQYYVSTKGGEEVNDYVRCTRCHGTGVLTRSCFPAVRP